MNNPFILARKAYNLTVEIVHHSHFVLNPLKTLFRNKKHVSLLPKVSQENMDVLLEAISYPLNSVTFHKSSKSRRVFISCSNYRLAFIFVIFVFGYLHTSAQTVRHTYRFTDNLAIASPDCGPALLPARALGSCNMVSTGGSFITDTFPLCGVRRTVYRNNMHWGLQYPNPNGTITDNYTIQMYVKNTNWGDKTWTRIIDFSNGTSDAGIYYKANGDLRKRCLDFYPNGVIGQCPFFDDTTYYLLTFTRNAATRVIDVYVNNKLFVSYLDNQQLYVGKNGVPIFIYRDDAVVACESGEANFSYLSFTNQYSSQASVDAVYNDLCSLTKTNSADFTILGAQNCNPVSKEVTIKYTGFVEPPGNDYVFAWNWKGGEVISGSGMGPYVVKWNTPGIKDISLSVKNIACPNVQAVGRSINITTTPSLTVQQTICYGKTYLGYNKEGTYTDSFKTGSGCDSVRTLQLTVLPQRIQNITQTICDGQNYMNYTRTGNYSDTFKTGDGCDSIRNLQLTVLAKLTSNIRQSICEGQTYSGYGVAGRYLDTFRTARGCDSIRTLDLTIVKKPLPDLGPDKVICLGDTISLTPGVFLTYIWQDGSTKSNLPVTAPGTYSVTVTNTCGSAQQQVTVTAGTCDVKFPSAFSPDRDGRNDLFGVTGRAGLQSYKLSVFNRWGQKLFESQNPMLGWDGTYRGKLQDGGIYVWVCQYSKNNVRLMQKGTVMLVR